MLFLPSMLLFELIATIDSPQGYINISKVIQPAIAQKVPSNNTENTENSKPIAVAGSSQTVKSGDQVQLDGTESYDPDCQNGNDKWCTEVLKYEWEPYGGPEIKDWQSSDVAKPKPSFIAPPVSENTDLSFELTVTDDNYESDYVSVTITVLPAIEDPSRDQLPVANAGQDRTVGVEQEVHLDGTRSRPEGALKSSEWKQTGGPHVELSDADTLQPTFSAPSVEKSKKLTFELVVYGAAGASKPDIVTVRVEPTGEDGGQPVRDQPSHESDITFNATISKIKDLVSDLKQNDLSRFLPFAGLVVGAIAVAYGIHRSKKSKHKAGNVAVITRGGIE